ncbi:MAG: class I SAM-dependent methyltransferase [Pseudomonadota bacterium]
MGQTHSEHYDESYFDWQRKIGEFGGKANFFKFKDTLREHDTVLDFGCGGGFLLNEITCHRKIGIEPNPSAQAQIEEFGIELFASSQEALQRLGEGTVDVIISNNALEHTLHPLAELKALYRLLKVGGKIHFVVPCEAIKKSWHPNNINYHLYSWSPMNLGNLFTEAGFEIIRVAPYIHKWPPHGQFIQETFGWDVFNLAARIYGRIERSWYQVEALCQKAG